MTDTLQALIKEGHELAIWVNKHDGSIHAQQLVSKWNYALKAYRANPPKLLTDISRKGGEANTPLQQQARLKNLPNKKGKKNV